MKALKGTLIQEKALVGAFFVIVKTDCETDVSLAAIARTQWAAERSRAHRIQMQNYVQGLTETRTHSTQHRSMFPVRIYLHTIKN